MAHEGVAPAFLARSSVYPLKLPRSFSRATSVIGCEGRFHKSTNADRSVFASSENRMQQERPRYPCPVRRVGMRASASRSRKAAEPFPCSLLSTGQTAEHHEGNVGRACSRRKRPGASFDGIAPAAQGVVADATRAPGHSTNGARGNRLSDWLWRGGAASRPGRHAAVELIGGVAVVQAAPARTNGSLGIIIPLALAFASGLAQALVRLGRRIEHRLEAIKSGGINQKEGRIEQCVLGRTAGRLKH